MINQPFEDNGNFSKYTKLNKNYKGKTKMREITNTRKGGFLTTHDYQIFQDTYGNYVASNVCKYLLKKCFSFFKWLVCIYYISQ